MSWRRCAATSERRQPIAPLYVLRLETPMPNPDEQTMLETALGWLEVGMIVLMLVLIPVIVLARVNARIGAPAKRRPSSGRAPVEIGAHI